MAELGEALTETKSEEDKLQVDKVAGNDDDKPAGEIITDKMDIDINPGSDKVTEGEEDKQQVIEKIQVFLHEFFN